MLTLPFPWWVLVIMLFICFSGYKLFQAVRAEKRIQQHNAEWAGRIYMERLKQERSRRGY